MLLGFKRQFETHVENGSKTHTIRGDRKDGKPPRVGETCHCYVDPRRKTMRLLGRWPCVRVERITISKAERVTIGGVELSVSEKRQLAWADGFRARGQHVAFRDMMKFWKGRLPFRGWIIHWKWAKQAAKPRAQFQKGSLDRFRYLG